MFFLFLYAGIVLYDRTLSLDLLYGHNVPGGFRFEIATTFSKLVVAVFAYTLPVTCWLLPYFLYRSQFSHYKEFAIGNMYMLRRFVNYYL